jgi:hypothetical protein
MPGEKGDFTACGLSLVCHPRSPMVRRRRRPDALLSFSGRRHPFSPCLEGGLHPARGRGRVHSSQEMVR